MVLSRVIWGATAALLIGAAPLQAQGNIDGVRPGAVQAEPSTLNSLGVRWPVVGDRNLNAAIAVAYRKAGEEPWAEGYPLFRTYNDRVSPENAVADGHLFAGSIVDLIPDTEYEIRLSLSDPDGGSTTQTLKLRTVPVPTLPGNMQRRFVIPIDAGQQPGGSGTQADPFRGLRAALQRAQPGDLLSLASGTYADGPYTVPGSGLAGRPIAVQGPADGSAVLDGRGADVLVNVAGRAYWWFDRLSFRGARTLIKADRASFVGVTRNRFDFVHLAFSARNATYKDSIGIYIADNTFVGVSRWPRSKGIEEIYAITVTGAGHVVAHNLIQNVGDGISNSDVGRLSASDIHNNDIETATDDGIETDYSDTNVRVYRNRVTNAFSGISFQPTRGGPVYVFRNALYNLQYTPFKLHNDMAGALIFHNTSVMSGIPFNISISGETVRDVVTRNNLIVGTGSPALTSTGLMSRTDFDSDGYEWAAGGAFARWNGKDYPSTMTARGSGALYTDKGAYTMGPHRTFAKIATPAGSDRRIDRSMHDPRLGPASRAIDRGVRLPNFNDRFGGKAPDLGCCESGEDLPHYGPRLEELAR
jgi:hypothetical protein